MATFSEARDDLFTLFKSAWDVYFAPGTNEFVDWPNVSQDDIPPSADTPWARVTLQHVEGRQGSLSNDQGRRRWDEMGLFTAQIFVPVGEGTDRAYNLSKAIRDTFRGASTTNQVWLRRATMREVGPEGNWFQVNVTAEFEYDEVA